MELTTSTMGDSTRVCLSGDIDERGAEQLKSALSSLSLAGTKTLCLDFQGVAHIGSAGLGKLLLCYKRFSAMGVAVRVENTSAQLRELFGELRLDTLFAIS